MSVRRSICPSVRPSVPCWGALPSRCWPGGPGQWDLAGGPGLGALAWGLWPGGPSLGALAWGPWSGGPRLGALVWGPWSDGQTYGQTKYPLYSTGHHPCWPIAQKAMGNFANDGNLRTGLKRNLGGNGAYMQYGYGSPFFFSEKIQ